MRIAWWVLISLCLAVAASAGPLSKGLELSYEGEAELSMVQGEQPASVLKAALKVTDLVTQVDQEGKVAVASLRIFEQKGEEDEEAFSTAAVRFLDLKPDGSETPIEVGQLYAEVPPFGVTGQFAGMLPVYFVRPDQMKEGAKWSVQERLLSSPLIEGRLAYQVQGQEKVGEADCWTISRALPEPTSSQEMPELQVTKISDTLWADVQTGLIRRAERQTVMQFGENQQRTTVLRLTLKECKPLDEPIFHHRLQELEAVKAVHEKVGIPLLMEASQEKVEAAEQAIADFQAKFQDSPYNAHLETWKQFVQMQREQMEAEQRQTQLIGETAPDFELPGLDGKTIKLSDLKGKVVLLDIFAYWCGPCNAEAPRLEKNFWQAYKDKGVVVLGVAVWAEEDAAGKAREFVDKHKLTFPVLVDAEDSVVGMYGVQGVPTNVVIGKDGKVTYVQAGFDEEGVKRAMEEAMK